VLVRWCSGEDAKRRQQPIMAKQVMKALVKALEADDTIEVPHHRWLL
jgi:hypothetical protein